MMFKELLKNEILKDCGNYYKNNSLFPGKKTLKKSVVLQLKRLFFNRPVISVLLSSDAVYRKIFLGRLLKGGKFRKHMAPLEYFYSNLATEESKYLLLKVVEFRLLGNTKVKFPLDIKECRKGIKEFSETEIKGSFIDIKSNPWKLPLYDTNKFGYPFKIFINLSAGFRIFVLNHYVKIIDGKNLGPEKDDVIIDLGGCFGETAIFFSHLTGDGGKVYSFEFIPGNISVFKKNLEVNNIGTDKIEIVEHPVWDVSGKDVFYSDAGSKSKVRFKKFEGYDGESSTVTVDDFVNNNNILKVDFIKTDIEAAEPYALRGAEKTLRRFKPKLAISIYHGLNDFTGIIRQINELNLGYKFYLGHYSLGASETVLYCSVK